jgi:D-aspartate ligase
LTSQHESPALVVGLSIHGLAVARALARQGVAVHCLSDVESPPQPTVHTRYAKVHFRRGLNTGPLPVFLNELADQIGARARPVLFPTSDRIAKSIANAWPQLSARYLLSWADCRDLVLRLQRKDSLPEYCERAGVTFPRSRVVTSAHDCETLLQGLQFPLVAKPAQPLSSFKAIRVATMAELQRCVADYGADLPFVVQEWIEGPEPSLYSCTSYLVRGEPLYLFTSRKIAASPPGVGQGTVFETVDAPEVGEISAKFVRTLDLTGPVAVEFKRDAAGRFWLIEPNVGRTEYCVDLAIQSGFNLPYMEYLQATGQSTAGAFPTHTRECAWFDTDKDPRCFLANLDRLRTETGSRRKAIFPFFGHDDWRPLQASMLQLLRTSLSAAGRRVSGARRRVEA